MGLLLIGIGALLAGREADQRHLLLRREGLHLRQDFAEVEDIARAEAVDGGLEPFHESDLVRFRANAPVRRDRDGGAVRNPFETEVVGAFVTPRDIRHHADPLALEPVVRHAVKVDAVALLRERQVPVDTVIHAKDAAIGLEDPQDRLAPLRLVERQKAMVIHIEMQPQSGRKRWSYT